MKTPFICLIALFFSNNVIAQEEDSLAFIQNMIKSIDDTIQKNLCIVRPDDREENGVAKHTICYVSKDNGQVLKMVERNYPKTNPRQGNEGTMVLYFLNDQLLMCSATDTLNHKLVENYQLYFLNDVLVKKVVEIDEYNFTSIVEWVLMMADSVKERCTGK